MIFGLDIASYQDYPDMAGLKRTGHDFVISKVTGEGLYVNPFWANNRENARKAGLLFGTYDWVEPQSGVDGATAALDYLRMVDLYGGRQPGELLTVDFESPEWHTGPLGRNIEAWMREYMYTLREKSRQPVGIYTATYFLQETGAAGWDWLARDFWYWQAAPGADAMMPDDSFWPATTVPFAQTVIHQHQWHGTSPFVVIEFDRNRFRGTQAELAAYGMPGVPEDKGGEVKEPPPGTVTWYINGHGEPIFAWNAGGQTGNIVGVNIVDLGMSVESFTEAGTILDISIKDGVAGDYHERPAPDGFVADPGALGVPRRDG